MAWWQCAHQLLLLKRPLSIKQQCLAKCFHFWVAVYWYQCVMCRWLPSVVSFHLVCVCLSKRNKDGTQQFSWLACPLYAFSQWIVVCPIYLLTANQSAYRTALNNLQMLPTTRALLIISFMACLLAKGIMHGEQLFASSFSLSSALATCFGRFVVALIPTACTRYN